MIANYYQTITTNNLMFTPFCVSKYEPLTANIIESTANNSISFVGESKVHVDESLRFIAKRPMDQSK